MSVNISPCGLIRGTTDSVYVFGRQQKQSGVVQEDAATESRVSASRPQQRRGRGALGGRGRNTKKQKRQQMLWRFLDKATHVLRLEGIAEMTVKPQQSPALSDTGVEETLERVSLLGGE